MPDLAAARPTACARRTRVAVSLLGTLVLLLVLMAPAAFATGD
ncbi:MAG: hypothetical protein QOD73_1472, partial [Solirubrobacteraceae bacterium]|nr:hypothetical protein [Solirubrobacteraceae bacterium]